MLIYVKPADKDRCAQALSNRRPISITGLDHKGELVAATGVVTSVTASDNVPFPEYPIHVGIKDG